MTMPSPSTSSGFSTRDVRDDVVVRIVNGVNEGVELHVPLINGLMLAVDLLLDKRGQGRPVFPTEENEGDPTDLLGLHERYNFKELVERAEATREVDVHFGGIGEHHLAHEEMVEAESVREIWVVGLHLREIDVEPDRGAPRLKSASISRLHNAGGATRDYRESLLGEPSGE